MNSDIVRLAYQARGYVIALQLRHWSTAKQRGSTLPLPLVACWWPEVKSSTGPLAWLTYRWPLNASRWCVAHTWSCRWDGSRRPKRQALARLCWSLAASIVGASALVAASLLTVLAVPVWLVGNAIGAGLIVLGGWSAPVGSVVDNLEASWLEEWASSVGPDLVEPQVTASPFRTRDGRSPSHAAGTSDWTDDADPVLAAQHESTAELRRYNDLLEAQQRADRVAAAQQGAGGSSSGLSSRARSHSLVRLFFIASSLFAAGLIGGASMLSVAASWNADAVPPTFAEIESGIRQRNADRQAHFATELEPALVDESSVEP